ncbi:MAG: cation transporter [Spirochaetes bacterium]|nr:cation transporter [Spirochaetota bacterium]
MELDLLKTANSLQTKRRQQQTSQVVNLGLSANVLLAVVKVAAGLLGHSKALLADGINSVSDTVYFILVKLLVKLSGEPADEEHPYGHHQFETIAAVVIGAFVITTGIAIFWDSINSFFDLLSGNERGKTIRFFTLIVSVATIVVKILLMINAFSVSRKTDNIAVSALARDHRNDIFASSAAALGISLSLFGLDWVDPLASALVAVIVVKTGIDILRESAAELMDTVPGKEMDSKIRTLLAEVEQVKSVECVHAHRFGPYYMVNITIGVEGDLTVFQCDAIADRIEQLLCSEIELLRKVYIHYHPSKLKQNSI